MSRLHWLGFWVFMSVYVVCEAFLYHHGHDTFFWHHKTKVELEIQRSTIDAASASATKEPQP